MKRVQCKLCGVTGLYWFKATSGWHLTNGTTPHTCDPEAKATFRYRPKRQSEPAIIDYLRRVPPTGNWETKSRRAKAS